MDTLLCDSDEEDTGVSAPDYTKRIDDLVTRDLQWFRDNRIEQYQFAQRIVDYIRAHPEMKNIVVEAEEKTGKREIVEIIALLTENDYRNQSTLRLKRSSAMAFALRSSQALIRQTLLLIGLNLSSSQQLRMVWDLIS